MALELQKGTAIRVLWGTAQLFKHPRYMHGAATSEGGWGVLAPLFRRAHARWLASCGRCAAYLL